MTPEDRRPLIAVDLGAESCRVSMLSWHDGEPRIQLIHRIANGPVEAAGGTLRWPLQTILEGVEDGLHMAAQAVPEGIRSIAVDGWAVDYVRLDDDGVPLSDPFCYRDERTVAAETNLHTIMPIERLRLITGVQIQRLNTLYQLHADRMQHLPAGRLWLNLPEYLLHRWGGAAVAEYTNATHTGMVELDLRRWSDELLAAAGIDPATMPTIVPPGTMLGPLTGPLAKLPAFRATELIAPACHDTASAIAGIPAHGEDWAYISSGTWSLVGTVLSQSSNKPSVRADDFTNLGGVGNSICFHRNVNGLWLLKQSMDAWQQAGVTFRIVDLIAQAELAPTPDALLDVDDPDLLLVGHMPARINAQRLAHGLPPMDESPANAPAIVSLILHSLAARYAQVLARIAADTGKTLKRLFIVGGGSRNQFLNRLTAKATGLEVHVGSAESSTIGNFAVQLAALEHQATGDEGFRAEVAAWASRLLQATTR